jgi:hypothetical protein
MLASPRHAPQTQIHKPSTTKEDSKSRQRQHTPVDPHENKRQIFPESRHFAEIAHRFSYAPPSASIHRNDPFHRETPGATFAPNATFRK